jgi:hypothetical protein
MLVVLAVWLAACTRSAQQPEPGNIPVSAIAPVSTTILAPPATAAVSPSPLPSPAVAAAPSPSPLASPSATVRRE